MKHGKAEVPPRKISEYSLIIDEMPLLPIASDTFRPIRSKGVQPALRFLCVRIVVPITVGEWSKSQPVPREKKNASVPISRDVTNMPWHTKLSQYGILEKLRACVRACIERVHRARCISLVTLE